MLTFGLIRILAFSTCNYDTSWPNCSVAVKSNPRWYKINSIGHSSIPQTKVFECWISPVWIFCLHGSLGSRFGPSTISLSFVEFVLISKMLNLCTYSLSIQHLCVQVKITQIRRKVSRLIISDPFNSSRSSFIPVNSQERLISNSPSEVLCR